MLREREILLAFTSLPSFALRREKERERERKKTAAKKKPRREKIFVLLRESCFIFVPRAHRLQKYPGFFGTEKKDNRRKHRLVIRVNSNEHSLGREFSFKFLIKTAAIFIR